MLTGPARLRRDAPLYHTRQAAGRWLIAVVALTLVWFGSHVAAVMGAPDLSSLAMAAMVFAVVRHATLSGWCSGWHDRGVREIANQLREHR